MGVIQLKHGSQSAAPSSLLNGEFAINVDSNQLWYGSGSNNTPISDIRLNSITAEKYIISSSVTHMTTSFSSGSTEFGNSADDTHTFTGSITASGDVEIGEGASITSKGDITLHLDKDNNDAGGGMFFIRDGSNQLLQLDQYGTLSLSGSFFNSPSVILHNTSDNDSIYPKIDFKRSIENGAGVTIGQIDFEADDSAGNLTDYARIIGTTKVTTNGQEGGLIKLQVASHDAELVDGLIIEDGSAEDEIDVTIASGANSLTTVAGNLTVNGAIEASGHLSSSENAIVTNVSASGDIYFTGDLVGKQREVYQCSFEGLRTTSKNYLPLATTDESTAPYLEENCIMVPTDGKVVSVTVRPTILNSFTSGDLTITVETQPLNVVSSTTAFTVEETKAITMGSSDTNHAFHLVFDNDKHFETGELLAIGIKYASAYSPPASQYWYVTAVIEYDWRNQGFTATGEYDAAV